jgi:hypothetical protein
MLPEFQEYYQQLLTAFHSHEATSRTEMEMIEACFKSSLDQFCRYMREGDTHRDSEYFMRLVPSPSTEQPRRNNPFFSVNFSKCNHFSLSVMKEDS